jgi:hypothetical protein
MLHVPNLKFLCNILPKHVINKIDKHNEFFCKLDIINLINNGSIKLTPVIRCRINRIFGINDPLGNYDYNDYLIGDF